ncbi:MAG TPA: cytochrome P450 [Gammaproteobacteria bacterium]|nr:cytochrome P450 [Gammaproteobacteria bacterium]
MKTLPVSDVDMFEAAAVRDARRVDDSIREMAPVVWLAREEIAVLGRFEHVSKSLADWQSFSSRSRPWHDPKSVRPEILLTEDPPRHTQVRLVLARALAPKMLSALVEPFRRDADAVVERALGAADGVVDAVDAISRAFVYKVLPDALGLPSWGRENMAAFGHMVWATMGPQNELFAEAMQGSAPVIEWVDQCCNRENLTPDGLGMQMFLAADRGEITEDEAKLLVQILLSAAADTTVMTISTAIRAFAAFPEQYELLRSDPSAVRAAFDESLRWDSPSRLGGRITTRDVEIEGYVIPAGTRCGLLFATANRDPRHWEAPERFDIRRKLQGQLGWGHGVHACVGRPLAQLEADAMLGAMVRKIERFEPAGESEAWLTTIGHGPLKLPMRLHPA